MTYPIDFRRKVLSVRERDGLTLAQVATCHMGCGATAQEIGTPKAKQM